MPRVYPLRAKLGQSKPKKGKRKRGGSRALKAASGTVPLSEKAAAARKDALNKLLAVRNATTPRLSPSPENSKANAARNIKVPSLRALGLPTLLRIWKNAVRLSAEIDGKRRSKGLQALVAIEREWERRRLTPLNPDDYFSWPTTLATGRTGEISFGDSPAEGVLAYMEYHVGRTSDVSTPVRRIILDRVFLGVLPPVFSKEYLNEWSSPGSATRLRKIAESIAAFCRNAKRRDTSKLNDAIKDWESDLSYLRDQYYVGKFHFGWPTSSTQ